MTCEGLSDTFRKIINFMYYRTPLGERERGWPGCMLVCKTMSVLRELGARTDSNERVIKSPDAHTHASFSPSYEVAGLLSNVGG